MKKIYISLLLLVSIGIGAYIINDYYATEVRNDQIRREIAEVKSIPQPPPPHQMKREKNGVQLDLPPVAASPDMTLEVVGVLKVQINENNSWETIAKLLVLVLFSYGGIKFINRKFA